MKASVILLAVVGVGVSGLLWLGQKVDRIASDGPTRESAVPVVQKSEGIFVKILGAVEKPGLCKIRTDAPLEDEMAAATGGFIRFADKKRIHVVRHDRKSTLQTIIINLQEKREQPVGALLKDGDVIFVSERLFERQPGS